jgi:hypothetical protein
MKKLILFLGLFLIYTGFSNAQKTKTITYREAAGPIFIDCYCGENYLGTATGVVDLHWVVHFVDEQVVWVKLQGSKSTLLGMVGEIKGETFTTSEMDLITENWNNHIIVHSNLKGDRGHHFIWSGYIDFEHDAMVYYKAICPGDK